MPTMMKRPPPRRPRTRLVLIGALVVSVVVLVALSFVLRPGGRPKPTAVGNDMRTVQPRPTVKPETEVPLPTAQPTVESLPPTDLPTVLAEIKHSTSASPRSNKVVTAEDFATLDWAHPVASLDLSLVYPVRESESVVSQLQLLLPTATRNSHRLEVILVADSTVASPSAYAAERSLCASLNVGFTVVQATAETPFSRPTYAQKLQAGLNASAAERVLFLSPHGTPLESPTGFIDAMLESANPRTVVGCTSYVASGNQMQQLRVLQAGYTGAVRAPGWYTTVARIGFGVRPEDFDPLEIKSVTAPSIHCLLADRDALRYVGGFRTAQVTLYDAYAEQLDVNISSRERWAAALDVEVTNTEYSMSHIEVRDLAFMSAEAKALLSDISVLLNRCESVAKQLGHQLSHNIGAMNKQGFIRPLNGDVSLRVIESVLRIKRLLSQIETLESHPQTPVDAIAWSLIIRAVAKDSEFKVDISTSAALVMNLGSLTGSDGLLLKTELQSSTFTVPEFPSKVWKIFTNAKHTTLGVPLSVITVMPTQQSNQFTDIAVTWAAEEPFVKQTALSLANDCPALTARVIGAAAAFASMPLSAQKARFCGLVYVALHGGIYRDADVGPQTQLITWFDPARGFFAPNEKGDVDLSFFAAKQDDHHVLHAIRAIVQTMALVAADDAALLTDTAFLAAAATPSLAPLFTAKTTVGLVLHHHASTAWAGTYMGWQAERARLSRDFGFAPRRRVIFASSNTERSTTQSEVADADWARTDSVVNRLVVTDANCTETLDQAAAVGGASRFSNLVRVLPGLQFEARQFLCTAAALYLFGGVGMSWETRPRRQHWQQWIPRAHLFFGTLSRRSGVHEIDVELFGATARSPCLLDLLTLANDNVGQLQGGSIDANSAIRKLILGANGTSTNCVGADAPQLSSLDSAFHVRPRSHRHTWLVNSTIPKQVWLINAVTEPDPAAAAVDAVWKREEPTVPRRVLDFGICRNLASNFPDMLSVYDNLKLDIMRADTCRLLVLYFRGGVYMDLDVHWRAPLSSWFNPEQSLVVGSADDVASGGSGNIANWFIAAAPKHPCIYDALKAITVEKPDAPQGIHVVDRTGVVGFTAATRKCLHLHQVETLPPRALTTDFVLHSPRVAGGWRNHLYSLTVATVWPMRFVIPRVGDTLSPAEEEVMKLWVANEPEMRHVVATMKDCVVALSQADPQLTWFVKNIRTLPSAVRHRVCRLAIAQHWGAVYMDSDIEWTDPMVSWVPLSGNLFSLVRVRDKMAIEPGIIVSARHDRCAQQVLSTMELRVGTARGYNDYINNDWVSFALGEGALTSVSGQCSQVSLISTIVRRDVLAPPSSLVPFQRVAMARHDPLPSGPEMEIDAQWTIEEAQMTRRMHGLKDCKDLAGKSRSIFEKLSLMPSRLQRVVCSLVLVHEIGGYYVDERTRWQRPLIDWLPAEESIVIPRDETGKVIPWFFGATKEHPCLERALAIISHRISTVANFSALTPSQESYVAGYRAFRDGVKGCSPTVLVISSDSPVAYSPGLVLPVNPAAEVIPRTVHLIWNTTALHSPAKEIHEDWLAQEPTFRRRIVTDDECRDLASRFPGLLVNYDAMPLNVMRADTCRVLAVFYYGGIYMDLDVEWVRPTNHWLDLTRDIVIANETENGPHVCNWFFAAKARHPCIERVLEIITERSDPAIFAKTCAETQHFVHYTTGPAAFTAGLQRCAVPSLSSADVTHIKIFHQYASTQWKSDYPSWRSQREAISLKCQKKNAGESSS